MKIRVIQHGYFKLDGGAMFGVVPRSMWSKLNPPDENNLCTWTTRSVLIEHQDRLILVDTGIGNKQGDKFRSHFHPHDEKGIDSLLAEYGYTIEDITDVFLTHLHFDHVGGAVSKNENGELLPTFPNAIYWSNSVHYDWAFNPNAREEASFLKENFTPLQEAGVLKFIPLEENYKWMDDIHIRFSNGHTEAMMMLDIKVRGRRLLYCADLFPSSFHIRMPYVMSYDIRPLQTLTEKEIFLQEALEEEIILFFEHDPFNECGIIGLDSRDRFIVKETMSLYDIWPEFKEK